MLLFGRPITDAETYLDRSSKDQAQGVHDLAIFGFLYVNTYKVRRQNDEGETVEEVARKPKLIYMEVGVISAYGAEVSACFAS